MTHVLGPPHVPDTEPYPRPAMPPTGPPTGVLTPRAITLSAATVLTSLLVAGASLLPVPYAVTGPGPTRNTLGEVGDISLISIQDAPTYEPTGKLLLTTVSVAGGPDHPVTLVDVLAGWLDRTRSVAPVEAIFEPTESRSDIDTRNQAAMISSQENATVAALEELGYEVPTVLNVAGVAEGTGAEGVLLEGDVVVAVDGHDVPSFSELSARMDDVEPPGSVVIGVDRDGVRQDLEVTTVDDGNGRALLGVFIDPVFDLPVDVTIAIEDIGGPSAGTMFARGIIDLLTEEDEANGLTIAGTGTMDLTGAVGPIGGIQQKMAGAARDGATWFLAPQDNCDEVVGNVPGGLQVVKTGTLAEARAAVAAIGSGDGGSLPTCT